MSKSVLVIDNDENIVRLLTFVFEEKGYTVYTAFDGVEGVGLALLHKPSVIICDVVMGEMHGFEVLQKVRSHPDLAGVVVIVEDQDAPPPMRRHASWYGKAGARGGAGEINDLRGRRDRHAAHRPGTASRMPLYQAEGPDLSTGALHSSGCGKEPKN